MRDMKSESFYLNRMARPVREDRDCEEYVLNPEYGLGKITTVPVFPGLLLLYCRYEFNKDKFENTEPDYESFSRPMIKIGYGLRGRGVTVVRDGKACVSGKDHATYYHGTANIAMFEAVDLTCRMFALDGYSSDIARTLEEVFFLRRDKIEAFFRAVSEEKDVAVIPFNAVIKKMVGEMETLINVRNYEQLRLAAVNLLLYEINHYSKNRARKSVPFRKSTVRKIMDVEKYISDNLDKKISLRDLSETFGLSVDTLKACFRNVFSMSVHAYIKKQRLEHGQKLLRETEQTVLDIALSCGYESHHSFTKAFRQEYRITPREIRKNYC